jgi:hypothetical protein
MPPSHQPIFLSKGCYHATRLPHAYEQDCKALQKLSFFEKNLKSEFGISRESPRQHPFAKPSATPFRSPNAWICANHLNPCIIAANLFLQMQRSRVALLLVLCLAGNVSRCNSGTARQRAMLGGCSGGWGVVAQ